MIRLITIIGLTFISLTSPLVGAKGVDVEAKVITVPIYQEPRILDSMSAPTVEFTAEILAHIQEGLMRLDSRRRRRVDERDVPVDPQGRVSKWRCEP